MGKYLDLLESVRGSGRSFTVFRVADRTDVLLQGKNAANINGIAVFIDQCLDRGIESGDFIHMFEVVNYGDGFGKYERNVGSLSRSANHVPNSNDQKIGRLVEPFFGGGQTIWYSFPVGGTWEASLVKSVYMDEYNRSSPLNREAQKLGEEIFNWLSGEQKAEVISRLLGVRR